MTSKNLAARPGRWSASYRKTAVSGWILFVVWPPSSAVVRGRRPAPAQRPSSGGFSGPDRMSSATRSLNGLSFSKAFSGVISPAASCSSSR